MSESISVSDALGARLRSALGAWAQRLPDHLVADFAAQITIQSVSDFTVHAAFLNCLVDSREGPVERQIPFQSVGVPPIADRNDPWSLPVGLKGEFLDQEETIVACDPGDPVDCNRCSGGALSDACVDCRGQKVLPCEACTRKGRKSCAKCKGEGKTPCSMCAGTGKVVASVDSSGIPTLGVCTQCTGKKEFPCHDCLGAPLTDCAACSNRRSVACATCAGTGAKRCAHCGGAGRFMKGFSYRVKHTVSYYRSFIRDANVPEEVFPEDPPPGKLGETVFETQEFEGTFGSAKLEGVAADAYTKVLAQAPAPGDASKLILQSVSIEQIPIYKVTYGFDGASHEAWVGFYENRVVALDNPFAGREKLWAEERAQREAAEKRARLTALRWGAMATAVAALLIPGIWEFVQTSPNRHWPLAILGFLILGVGLGSIWLMRNARVPSAAVAAAAALLVAASFGLAAPIHRLDVREFAAKLSAIQAAPFSEWTAVEASALSQLIKEFSARGVDTAAAETLSEEYANFAAAEKERAAREAERVRHEAAVAARNAEIARQDAARRAKALAKAKAAARKHPAPKKPAKKKPAKKKAVKRRV